MAEKLGIPAVRTVPNLAANDTYSQVDEQLTAGLGVDHPEMAALTDDIAAFVAQHDVELEFAATMDVTEALNLVFLPREFQPAAGSFDARFQFLGPMLGDRELGLGTPLDAETLTVDILRAAVGQVTSSPKVRANLDRMRMAAHNGGGASGGAAAVEEYLYKT